MSQYHVALDDGDVGRYVLLPGDPARATRIATRFDEPRHVATNREFTTWTGTLDGVPVSVCSTGIGSPSTAIAVEELCNVGADTLVRVGTCGGLQPHTRFGDLVVVQAAVRQDGTSVQYTPVQYPAIADLDVTTTLRDVARARGARHHVGVSVSGDAFYCEIEPERMPNREHLVAQQAAWTRAGAAAAEMECATLFIAGALRGARTGGLCIVSNQAGSVESFDPASLDVDLLIDTAVDALRVLIRADQAGAGGATQTTS